MAVEDVFGIVGTTQAGNFHVERVVAEGGFGVVYCAQHSGFRAPVALKCLKVPEEMTQRQREIFLEKFREEAELLFRLSRAIPEVVQPLHVDVLHLDNGLFVPFLAMEWLEGESLDGIITRRNDQGQAPLGIHKLVKLLRPIAIALAKAHRFQGPRGIESIIHRDLKPENIFVASIGGIDSVKILDFGIAKARRVASEAAGRITGKATDEDESNSFTPAYAAPEQWAPRRFGQTGPWTDVWGLALTMVEALAGHPPIDGDLYTMRKVALDEKRRPTPRGLGVTVSDTVEAVFGGALAVDPRQRTKDIEKFWSDLEVAMGLQPSFGARRDVRMEVHDSVPPAAPSLAPAPAVAPAVAITGAQRLAKIPLTRVERPAHDASAARPSPAPPSPAPSPSLSRSPSPTAAPSPDSVDSSPPATPSDPGASAASSPPPIAGSGPLDPYDPFSEIATSGGRDAWNAPPPPSSRAAPSTEPAPVSGYPSGSAARGAPQIQAFLAPRGSAAPSRGPGGPAKAQRAPARTLAAADMPEGEPPPRPSGSASAVQIVQAAPMPRVVAAASVVHVPAAPRVTVAGNGVSDAIPKAPPVPQIALAPSVAIPPPTLTASPTISILPDRAPEPPPYDEAPDSGSLEFDLDMPRRPTSGHPGPMDGPPSARGDGEGGGLDLELQLPPRGQSIDIGVEVEVTRPEASHALQDGPPSRRSHQMGGPPHLRAPVATGSAVGSFLERLRGPMLTLFLTVIIGATDFSYTRTGGEPFMIGPLRPFWIEATLSVIAVVWLVWRVISLGERDG